MNNNDSQFSGLETKSILIDSLDSPKIKAGGSSSSTVLNQFHDKITRDFASLLVSINRLQTRVNNFIDAFVNQGNAVSSAVTTLNSRVDTLLTDSSFVMADFFTNRFISTSGNDTTCNVDNYFGNVTLPVTSSSDLLLQTDSAGNKQLSDAVETLYSVNYAPGSSDLIRSSFGVDMLLRKGPWVVKSNGQSCYFVFKAPLQYLGLNPNMLEIYPFPAFGCGIDQVFYQTAEGGTGSSLVPIDFTYVPGYTSSNPAYLHIENAGPIRIALPGVPMTQIRFRLNPISNNINPGLFNVRILSETYAQEGTLTIEDPDGRNIQGISIYGKDSADLALLPTTIVGAKATINVSSATTKSTPIITKVVASF